MMEPTPEYLWHDLHEKQGNSSLASLLAERVLNSIDTQNFTNLEVAEDNTEYSRIAAVTALSAAKKATVLAQAQFHLQRAMSIMADRYPMAKSVAEAKVRGEYWRPVYGKESAQLICLRDLLKLYRVLSVVSPSKALIPMISGSLNLLQKISQEKGSRFELIHLIEESDYEQAIAAFTDYLKEYGPGVKSYDATQVITVSSTMLGRAVDHKDSETALKAVLACSKITVMQPQLAPFTSKQIAINFSASRKSTETTRRLLRLIFNKPTDPEFETAVANFLEYQYIGLNDRVSNLKTSQREG